MDLCLSESGPSVTQNGKRQDCPISVTDDGMSIPVEIARGIESQVGSTAYGLDPKERRDSLLALLKKELAYACDRDLRFRTLRGTLACGFSYGTHTCRSAIPAVGAFKSNPPPGFGHANEVKRILTSSATTGQVPSRVVLDAETAKRMTKGVTTIIKDFIGPARRPYLVLDISENINTQAEMGHGGRPFKV